MRVSRFRIDTLRNAPADAEIASHKLLLRAGLIHMEAAGIYSWLPMGLRVLRKVSDIVRREMDATGALEVHLPMVQPAELWQTSGRWDDYGPELQRFEDRRGRAFCLGPTHEEVICALAKDHLKSWRDLPLTYYQIQTKYRGELRPRFGLMRAREFLMKDAYSFHPDQQSLTESYLRMRKAYCRVFERIGLEFLVVQADSGSIGGNLSEEFQAPAQAGEDHIVSSEGGRYAANQETARALSPPAAQATDARKTMREIATPDCLTIAAVCDLLKLAEQRTVKTLMVRGSDPEKPLWALILRGDHELNLIKAAQQPELASPLEMADEEEIRQAMGAGPGSLGPVNAAVPVLVDSEAAAINDFCCGANRDGFHFTGVNWTRDLELPAVRDLRMVKDGDPSPEGDGALRIRKTMEVGHIFQLGDKYSGPMGLRIQNQSGAEITPIMGCYGIGVSRIIAAVIEQNHDEKGIIWPQSIAPFQVHLIPLTTSSESAVGSLAEKLHDAFSAGGLEVLLDDRNIRAGIKLADAELLGIPHILILGERNLAQQRVEYRNRRTKEEALWPLDQLEVRLREQLVSDSAR